MFYQKLKTKNKTRSNIILYGGTFKISSLKLIIRVSTIITLTHCIEVLASVGREKETRFESKNYLSHYLHGMFVDKENKIIQTHY